jgi:hypothetical protein
MIARGLLLAALIAQLCTFSAAAGPPEQRPHSCRLLDDAERQCAFGQCDAQLLERLRRECLRDRGRP